MLLSDSRLNKSNGLFDLFKLQEKKYSVYTPKGDLEMFGMENITKELTIEKNTNELKVTLRDNSNSWSWETVVTIE